MFVFAFFIVFFTLATDARMCKGRNIPNCGVCGKLNPKCKTCNSGYKFGNSARTSCVRKQSSNNNNNNNNNNNAKVCRVGSQSRRINNCVKCGRNKPLCTQCRQGFRMNQARTQCLRNNQAPRPSPPRPSPPRPSPPRPSPPSNNLDTEDEWLRAHNTRRTKFLTNQWNVRGDVSVTWSPTLANSARAWARTLKQGGCTLRHQSNAQNPHGENLSGGRIPNNILNSWTEGEVISASTKYSSDSAHFTQVLWRSTEKIGCAIEYCNNGKAVSVCRYSKPGNCNMGDGSGWRAKVLNANSPCGSVVNNAEDAEAEIEEEMEELEELEESKQLEKIEGLEFYSSNDDADDHMPGWSIGIVVLIVLAVVGVLALVILTVTK